jgi:hypothetical protein
MKRLDWESFYLGVCVGSSGVVLGIVIFFALGLVHR